MPYAALSIAWKVQTSDIFIKNLIPGMHLCAKGGNYHSSFIVVSTPSPHDMRSSLYNDASLEPNKLIPPLTFRQFSLAEWSKC